MNARIFWIEYITLFGFGTIIGSFLNVIIYRVPAGLSLIKPGSHCPNCSRPIKPLENIPIISFILLRGKCKGCKHQISFQYPLVEAAMGGLLMLMLYKFGWTWDLLIYGVFCALMLSLSVIDIFTLRLPNPITLTGAITAVLLTIFLRREFLPEMIIGGFTGIGVLGLQGLAGWVTVKIVSKRKKAALGLGDVKFAGMIGLFLGPVLTIVMFLFGIVLGALFGIMMILSGKKKLGQRIPFGPYLAVGGILSLLIGKDLWLWYSHLLRL